MIFFVGAGRAEDVLRAWMSGLWQWDWWWLAKWAGGWRKGVQERGRCFLAEHQGSLSQFRFGRSQITQRLPRALSGLETSDVALSGPSTISPHNLA